MKKNRLFLLLSAAAGAVFCILSPLDAAPQVDARLDTTEIRIGDPLVLTLSVRSGPGETVLFPDPAGALEKFEILSSESPERYEEGNGATLERRSYRLTSFETGEQVIPELPFVLMATDGAVDTLLTREIIVDVISLVRDTTAEEVRPLKALLEVPPLWRRLALWALGGVLVLALLIWQVRRRLARRAGLISRARPAAPPPPAHLAAFAELERIKRLGLIEKGEIKQFHILVSDTIRRYIQAVYGVEAIDMTTWELSLALHSRTDGALQRSFQEFLEACDLVKFAKYKPPIVEINSVFNRAWDLVERTRPSTATAPAGSREQGGAEQLSGASSGPGEGSQT